MSFWKIHFIFQTGILYFFSLFFDTLLPGVTSFTLSLIGFSWSASLFVFYILFAAIFHDS